MDPIIGIASALGSAAIEVGMDRGVGEMLSGVIKKEKDLRAAMEQAREVYDELTRNVRFLQLAGISKMKDGIDDRDLRGVARDLQVDKMLPFTAKEEESTELAAFLNKMPIPETSITMLRLMRRVAFRSVDVKEGGRALLASPRHGRQMMTARRLNSLLAEMEEMRLYFREFPGIKPGTTLGPRAGLWKSLASRFWSRKKKPPIVLPLVEGRRAREAVLARQREVRKLMEGQTPEARNRTSLGGGPPKR